MKDSVDRLDARALRTLVRALQRDAYDLDQLGIRDTGYGKLLARLDGAGVARLVLCAGEAHRNAHIDGCSLCRDFAWGVRELGA